MPNEIMHENEAREILAAETRRHWTVEEAENILRHNDTPSARAALAAMRRAEASGYQRGMSDAAHHMR